MLNCHVLIFNEVFGILLNTDSDMYAETSSSTLIDLFGISSLSILDDSLIARSEYHLIIAFFHFILRIDPDILFCWDADKGALDYIARRASLYGMNMTGSLSRLSWPPQFMTKHVLTNKDIAINHFKSTFFDQIFNPVIVQTTDDRWKRKNCMPKGKPTGFGGKIGGRVCFNMWRLCRHEYKFTSFTIENVYAKVLGITKPKIANRVLLEKFNSIKIQDKVYVMSYVFDRLVMENQIIDSIGLVQRTIEMAKVFTINFESVLTRG